MSRRKSEFARIVDEENAIREAMRLQEKANRSPLRKIGDFFWGVFDWLDDYSEAIMLGIIALPLLIIPVLTTFMVIDIANTPIGEPKAEELPEPTQIATPDLSGFWPILGVAGAVVGLGLLITGLVFAIVKTRNAHRELNSRRSAAAAERQKALAVWNRYGALHRELSSKALSIETDWEMIFSYPALLDSSIPATREFHRLLRVADGLSPEAPADISLSTDIPSLPYPKAVTEADGAWTAALSFAKRTGTKLIPRAERKKVDQILKLLKLAQSAGGSEHERAVAYDRVSKLIGELQFLHVPEKALQAIGAESRLMLEPSVNTQVAEQRKSERVAIPL